MTTDTWNLLNEVRRFIESEYADPRVEPDGEWLAKDARHIHDRVCTALANYREQAALVPADVSALVERLNGVYRIPITDWLGPAGGEEPDNPNEFVRTFETPPIQKEAASLIQSQAARIAALEAGLGAMANEYIDYVEADMGRELRNGDLPPAWHRARALLNRRAEG